MAGQQADADDRPTAGDWQAGFVGRRAELAVLWSVLEVARSGSSRLVLIDGPAGIGKTALVRRFLGAAGVKCVLWASGDEAEMGLSFGVVEQLAAGAAGGTPLPEQLASLRRGGPPAEPLAVGGALVDLLGVLQRDRLLLLVVDDVQWADTPSLHALTFVLRRLRFDRMLALLVTREPANPRFPQGLRSVLASEHGVRLRLGGLDTAELRILAARLDAGTLSVRAATRLRDHTGGNPLHARALLEELPTEVLERAEDPLPAPRSFAMLVLARLATCPLEAQQLVAAASVLGLSCPLHLAARLATLDDPLPALEQAVVARLLQERPTSGIPLVAFPHPLVHAAIYQDLGPADRARLHAQAATLVDGHGASLWHRLRAASGPDPQLAADLAASARRHAAAGLWAITAEQLTRAARLVGIGRERERLIVEAVEALLLDGQVGEATALVAELPDSTDPGARCYVLGRLAAIRGRVPQAWSLLTEAWQRCDGSADPGLAARIAGQLATLCVLQARGRDAASWASQALKLGPDQTGSDHMHFVRLVGLGISGAIDQALALAATLPDPSVASPAELDGLLGRGLLRTWADDLTGAQRDLAGVLAACQDRSVPFRLLATSLLGQAEYRLGRWDDALIHSGVAISLVEDADQTWLAPMGHAVAALVPAARGEWERAAGHVHAAYDSTPRAGYLAALTYTASAHAHLAAARGDPREVVTALRPLLTIEARDGAEEPGVVPWHDLLVDALVTLGEYEQAEAVLVPFETLATARGRHSALAAAARARGNLHAARRDPARAGAAFRAGLEHAAQVAMPFERARLELAYGAFLRRAGRRTLASEQLEAAQGTLERLDARPYLERCQRELAACGRSPMQRHQPDRTRLTAQEQAVAQLVAEGLTNRQVARELVVSVKTVEYHLGHVYAKLQVTSRGQLAARFSHD